LNGVTIKNYCLFAKNQNKKYVLGNFEIGIIGAGILDKYSLSVMSITIQTIYMAFMVHLANFYFVRLTKTKNFI
jgi:hypothetical protein